MITNGGDDVRNTVRSVTAPPGAGYNRAIVIELIRRSGGMSRVELAEATGLSAQAVSNISQRLLDEGLAREGERPTTGGRGKPRTPLLLAADSRYAIGVHLDPSVLTTVIVRLDGTVLARRRDSTAAVSTPASAVSEMASAISELIAQSGIDTDRIVGVGIATPGPIDPDLGIVLDPPNLDAWHHVPLRDALAAATGFPVVLDKDVTAAAVAERWIAPPGADSFAFLYLGAGLGVGLMIRDEVIRGRSGNAGEIGHIVVVPEGPACTCGQRGCVAVTCTPAAIVGEAQALGVLDSSVGADATAIDAALSRLVAHARRGDRDAAAVLSRASQRISRVLAAVCNLLDVDRVILGGPLWGRLSSWLEQQLPRALTDQLVASGLHRVTVAGTSLGEDVGAIGAACLVLDAALAPHTSAPADHRRAVLGATSRA